MLLMVVFLIFWCVCGCVYGEHILMLLMSPIEQSTRKQANVARPVKNPASTPPGRRQHVLRFPSRKLTWVLPTGAALDDGVHSPLVCLLVPQRCMASDDILQHVILLAILPSPYRCSGACLLASDPSLSPPPLNPVLLLKPWRIPLLPNRKLYIRRRDARNGRASALALGPRPPPA